MPEAPRRRRALPALSLLLLALPGAARGHPPSAVDPAEPDVVAAAKLTLATLRAGDARALTPRPLCNTRGPGPAL